MTRYKPTVVIIDYGIGNRGSMQNMLRYVGGNVLLSADPADILSADRLVLPGVGSFDACIKAFHEHNVLAPLTKAVFDKAIPLLSVCVGTQMLFEGSDEGTMAGLGWLGGRVRHLRNLGLAADVKVLHMGWNLVSFENHPLHSADLMARNRFYFAHSYYCDSSIPEQVSARTTYGGKSLPVGFSANNISAYQFHPEKSHRFGLAFMRNFVHGE